MCHAGREHAERGEALAFGQRALGANAVGHVLDDDHAAVGRAAERRDRHLQVALLAVGGGHARLEAALLLALERRAQRDAGQHVGQGESLERALPSREHGEGRIGAQDAALGIEDDDSGG